LGLFGEVPGGYIIKAIMGKESTVQCQHKKTFNGTGGGLVNWQQR